MSQLVFTPPNEDTPGYARRVVKAMDFAEKMKGEFNQETINIMVEFLADFVTEPADRAEAIEALWDASEKQFGDMLSSLTGKVSKEEGADEELENGNFTDSAKK